jgi:hypothetical protein
MRASILGASVVDGLTIRTKDLLEREMVQALRMYVKSFTFGVEVDRRVWSHEAKIAAGPIKEYVDSHNDATGII